MPYELWTWVVKEEDGSEGAIVAFIPGLNFPATVLQARSRESAEEFRFTAQAHGRASGRPVRLAHLVEVEE